MPTFTVKRTTIPSAPKTVERMVTTMATKTNANALAALLMPLGARSFNFVDSSEPLLATSSMIVAGVVGLEVSALVMAVGRSSNTAAMCFW
ncbi:hypothetical protein D3C87_1535380 [compost metagenome]